MNQSSSRVLDFQCDVYSASTNRKGLSRSALCASLIWLVSAQAACAQPPEKPTSPPPSSEFSLDPNRSSDVTQEQIATWIKSLDHPKYATREWATYQLWQHRRETLPAIVQGIARSEGDTLDRLAAMLGNMADDADPALASKAFAELKKLSQGMAGTRSIVCKHIFESVRYDMAARNWDRITRLCKDPKQTFTSLSAKIRPESPLYINDSFQGTAADLNDLDLIDWVEFVRLEGPKINRDILEAVLKLPKLKHLQIADANLSANDLKLLINGPDLDMLEIVYVPLGDDVLPFLSQLPVWGTVAMFGTDLSQQGADKATAILADVDVVISRGAFLGVTCNQGAVMIESIERGSAAELAGLRRRDRLLKINDVPLEKFEDLRKQLARYAPGEEVTVEFERSIELNDVESNGSEPFDPNFFPLRRFEIRKMQTQVTLGRRQ